MPRRVSGESAPFAMTVLIFAGEDHGRPPFPETMVAAGETSAPRPIVDCEFPALGAIDRLIPQIFQHFAAILVSLVRLFLQRSHDYRADPGMNRGINLSRRDGSFR